MEFGRTIRYLYPVTVIYWFRGNDIHCQEVSIQLLAPSTLLFFLTLQGHVPGLAGTELDAVTFAGLLAATIEDAHFSSIGGRRQLAVPPLSTPACEARLPS